MSSPCKTPQNKPHHRHINIGPPMQIPPTPMLKNLGYGTGMRFLLTCAVVRSVYCMVSSNQWSHFAGVQVYRVERSPLRGFFRSPWALKRVTRRMAEQGESDPSFQTYKRRLADEAQILQRLDHPNIIGFRGVLPPQTAGDLRAGSLAMEMCEFSLGDYLEERNEAAGGPMPAAHIRRMCLDVSRALEYLHDSARLLHADLKSYNVLVKDEKFSVCKLCDFGVSLPLNAAGYVNVVAKPDARYIGTELWCAPEALLDDNVQNVSTKADVFSLGLVIYECVALMPPHSTPFGSVEDDKDDEEDDEEQYDDEEGADASRSTKATDTNDKTNNLADLCGTRPPLPEADDLGSEYNVVIELFFVCTNAEPDDRPSAASLVRMLEDGSDEA